MNRILQFAGALFVLLLLFVPFHAQGQSITTATITVTNGASNNFSLQINGQYRYFTNTVSNAYNQILMDTNGPGGSATIAGTASNVFLALVEYPQSQMTFYIPTVTNANTWTNGTNIYTNYVYVPSSNQIQLVSFLGAPMSVVIGSNWASLAYATFGTNLYTSVVVPPAGIGPVTSTNILSGLVQWLNESTNITGVPAVVATTYIWSNFINAASLASLSNYVGLISTNATNFSIQVGTLATNYSSNILYFYSNNIVYPQLNAMTNYFSIITNDLNSLTNLIANTPSYHDVGNTLGQGTASILMTNHVGTNRVEGWDGDTTYGSTAPFKIRSLDGAALFVQDNQDSTIIYDHAANTRIYVNSGASGGASGTTLFDDQNNHVSEQLNPFSGTAWFAMPPTVYQNAMPVVVGGMFTNFFDQEQNSSASDTPVNAVTIPGNAITNNGDVLVRRTHVKLTVTASRIQSAFTSGTDIVDSGTLTMAGSGYADVTQTITRNGADSYIYSGTIIVDGPTSPVIKQLGGTVSSFNTGSGWSAGTGPWQITLTGVTTGDLIILDDTVEYKPSHVWATFQ